MTNEVSRLALGTANFGLDYGINNAAGKLSDHQICLIIQHCSDVGIVTFDTAQAYGDSERRLGKLLDPRSRIITKVGVGPAKNYKKNEVSRAVQESIQTLNVQNVHAVLLHRPELLLGSGGANILKELKILKENNKIDKIGVSIYSPEVLEVIIKYFEPDIVQAPFNIFDQRLYTSGWAGRLKSMGTEIHVRSAFLQGLLLMNDHELPAWFYSRWPKLFDGWFAYQSELGKGADEIALGYCLQQTWADKVVIGVDNVDQLKRLLAIENSSVDCLFSGFAAEDEGLISPPNWNKI